MAKITETTFSVIDTETTGTNPETDRVVEVGIATLIPTRGVVASWVSLINPIIPIPPQASAIHHITDKDVENEPLLGELGERIQSIVFDTIVAAHNAGFDRSFLPMLSVNRPWLCTRRLARHLWPEAPGYANQVLRYWLGLKSPLWASPHRALPDAHVTACLLKREIEVFLDRGNPDDLDAFINFCHKPIEVGIMPFGKHKDKPLAEIPRDYLLWALGNLKDLDADLRWSMERALGNQK